VKGKVASGGKRSGGVVRRGRKGRVGRRGKGNRGERGRKGATVVD